MIPEQTIQEIKDTAAVNIVHIIGDRVRLKRNGNSYLGLCPFHNERTPSFSVSRSKGIYKCFGCGKSGDAIGFIMEQGRLSFVDTMHWVANRYNIAVSAIAGEYQPPAPKPYKQPQQVIEPEKIDCIPPQYLLKSMQCYERNSFLIGLTRLFGADLAGQAKEQYIIGTSKKYELNSYLSAVFWQIDVNQKIRQCNIMMYEPATLKRSRSDEMKPKKYGKWLAEEMHDKNVQCCFFGEHLLTEYPDKKVCIVESEKTAIVCSLFYPGYNWLATSGTSGVRWTEKQFCEALQGRTVKLYPDVKKYEDWNKKAEIIAGLIDVNISVSDLIERKATSEERQQGYDLADYLINLCPETGLALTDHGYPVMWDI